MLDLRDMERLAVFHVTSLRRNSNPPIGILSVIVCNDTHININHPPGDGPTTLKMNGIVEDFPLVCGNLTLS